MTLVDADYLPSVKEKLLNWAINRNSFDLFAGKAHELLNRKKEHDDFGSSTADVFSRFLSQNIETTDRIHVQTGWSVCGVNTMRMSVGRIRFGRLIF